MITIAFEHGRVGPFWWVNSDTTIQRALDPLGIGMSRELPYVRWGTAGFGKTLRIKLEVQE